MNGNHLTPRCPHCGAPLWVIDGDVYCEHCTAFAPTAPPLFTDAHGNRYRGGPVVPYSELTEGSFFALPGERVVRVRGRVRPADCPALRRQPPGVFGALYNRPVLLLERVDEDPDRLVWLEEDPDNPLPY